jgi:hypothetical protein
MALVAARRQRSPRSVRRQRTVPHACFTSAIDRPARAASPVKAPLVVLPFLAQRTRLSATNDRNSWSWQSGRPSHMRSRAASIFARMRRSKLSRIMALSLRQGRSASSPGLAAGSISEPKRSGAGTKPWCDPLDQNAAQLKVYKTSQGFFDLAIAAPSLLTLSAPKSGGPGTHPKFQR